MKNFESTFWTETDKPVSANASIKFEGGVKSSKLIRNLMNLCYNFGIGLTSPMLSQDNEELMIFGLKLIIPGTQYAKKYHYHMEKCVSTIEDYLKEVEKQMDFVSLDISMFSNFDMGEINFDSIANQRDNKYNGSWHNFIIDLTNNKKINEVKFVEKCIEFEEKNKTDLGIVSGQITSLLAMSKSGLFKYEEKN